MSDVLSDKMVKSLPLPTSGNRIHYDSKVRGFGIRLTSAGARSFILNYRTKTGRERRYTIGDFSTTGNGWGTSAARGEAERLKVAVKGGADPLASLEADRSRSALCARHQTRRAASSRRS
jgi:hypothetical protein